MEKIELQAGIIYGSINSRRLGSSLGINLMPSSYKLCSFNCIYCQYGQTSCQIATIGPGGIGGLPWPEKVSLALEDRLKSNPEAKYDYITFSGNGEPTLHPQFEEIVKVVKRIRDKFASQSKLAILSNGSTLERDHIQRALRELDLPIMKLDAGAEETFKKINQPHPSIRFGELVRNLKKTRTITIQTMFVDGETENSSDEKVRSWVARIKEIQPKGVQIYSLSRPAKKTLKSVPRAKLDQIVIQLREEGIQAKAY